MKKELNIYRKFYKGFEYWIIKPCHIRFKKSNNTPFHLCGYVVVDKNSKYFISEDYQDYKIECHWGLTFAGNLDYLSIDFAIGFDCAHFGDLSFNYEGDLNDINKNSIYRDVDFEEKEITIYYKNNDKLSILNI